MAEAHFSEDKLPFGLTNDALIAIIKIAYPDAVHGRDFWCGQPVDGDARVGPAFIAAWNIEGDTPTQEEIEQIVADNRSELVARFHPILTLEDLKAAKAAAIEAEGTARLSVGFSYDFGAPYGVKVLQLRPGTDDRLNWSNALAGFQLQIMAGNGAAEGALIRPADNQTMTLSYNAAAAALGDMLAWGQAHYATVWAKKDALAAATTEAEIEAVSVDTGWPA